MSSRGIELHRFRDQAALNLVSLPRRARAPRWGAEERSSGEVDGLHVSGVPSHPWQPSHIPSGWNAPSHRPGSQETLRSEEKPGTPTPARLPTQPSGDGPWCCTSNVLFPLPEPPRPLRSNFFVRTHRAARLRTPRPEAKAPSRSACPASPRGSPARSGPPSARSRSPPSRRSPGACRFAPRPGTP